MRWSVEEAQRSSREFRFGQARASLGRIGPVARNLTYVLLAYVDESYTKERYFIVALLVPDTEASLLASALDTIVEEASYTYGRIDTRAELHGYDLVAGKGDWLRLAEQIRVRIGIYNKAFQAIADRNVHVIIRSVDIPGLDRRYPNGHDHPHSIVLAHLLERVDDCAARQDQFALVIADEISEQDDYRRDLWGYQRSGTWGYRARKLTRIVDTIHFAPSRASRLVQAADLIAYMARRTATHIETDERAKNANSALWARIEPKIHHNRCWFP